MFKSICSSSSVRVLSGLTCAAPAVTGATGFNANDRHCKCCEASMKKNSRMNTTSTSEVSAMR